ncbi:hypothetical protein, partial [Pseudomonas syringae group genomosp. 3]|uniref:hypothetical protein n=1 Tax=Pseudomonas syringae group genomosp. 3 TaxID=251701 RepID=UPI001E359C34
EKRRHVFQIQEAVCCRVAFLDDLEPQFLLIVLSDDDSTRFLHQPCYRMPVLCHADFIPVFSTLFDDRSFTQVNRVLFLD